MNYLLLVGNKASEGIAYAIKTVGTAAGDVVGGIIEDVGDAINGVFDGSSFKTLAIASILGLAGYYLITSNNKEDNDETQRANVATAPTEQIDRVRAYDGSVSVEPYNTANLVSTTLDTSSGYATTVNPT